MPWFEQFSIVPRNIVRIGTIGKVNSRQLGPFVDIEHVPTCAANSLRTQIPGWTTWKTMPDNNSVIKETPVIKRVLWRKRWQSFAVVSLATFLLASMIWPLATRGYRSRAAIEVDVAKNPAAVKQFKTILDDVIHRNLSENALKKVISQVQSQMPSKVMDKLAALDSIRPMIEVSMSPRGDNGVYALDLQYSGRGTAAENHIINILTTNVARDFLSNPLASMGTGPKRSSEVLAGDFLATAHSLKENANQTIAGLEEGMLHGNPSDGGSESPFMTASSRQSYPSSADSDPSEDLGKLRQTVHELTSMVEQAHNQNSTTNGAIFSVRQVRSKSMEPIGCNPKVPNLILLGLLSSLIGAVVAFNFRPFEQKGFESIGSIPSILGIPVAATLNSRLSAEDKQNLPDSHWANSVVSFSELFLFATILIVLGFCFINTEIREAFADNLFHGFSRIFWMFRS